MWCYWRRAAYNGQLIWRVCIYIIFHHYIYLHILINTLLWVSKKRDIQIVYVRACRTLLSHWWAHNESLWLCTRGDPPGTNPLLGSISSYHMPYAKASKGCGGHRCTCVGSTQSIRCGFTLLFATLQPVPGICLLFLWYYLSRYLHNTC